MENLVKAYRDHGDYPLTACIGMVQNERMPKHVLHFLYICVPALFEAGAVMILPNDPEMGWLLVKIGVLLFLIVIWLWYREKRPSGDVKPTSKQKPNPFDALVKECKECDASHNQLTRKPEAFIMGWVRFLDRLRDERNVHDTHNLLNLIGGPMLGGPGGGNMAVGQKEVVYTLNCLEARGYLTLEDSGPYCGGVNGYQNKKITFNDKYDEFMKDITFKETGDGCSVHW